MNARPLAALVLLGPAVATLACTSAVAFVLTLAVLTVAAVWAGEKERRGWEVAA